MARSSLDFAAVFGASPNAYMLIDRELRFVAANAAYLRATAARLEDLLGRTVFEVFPNDPGDPNNASSRMIRDSFLRVLETRRSDFVALVPYRVARVPGGPAEERVWSATHTPILAADGSVDLILQHTTDVTGLRRSGGVDDSHVRAGVIERVRQVQASFSSVGAELRDLKRMFEQAPGFMAFLRGPDHVFEIANASFTQLVGHRAVTGMSVRSALPEVEGQGFFELLDSVYASGEAWVGHGTPIQLVRTPGAAPESRVVDFVYQPIRDGGQVVGIFVQGNDITDQKRLEAERDRQAQERLFLAESIPVQVWTARPDGELDFVSQRVADYFGTTREEVLGAGWQGRVHADDLTACVVRWTHSLRTGDPYEIEFRLLRADGVYRWHLGRAIALRDEAGAVRRWFGSNTDIDDARGSLAELQARVEYEQRLLGIVSHDLRNPLNSISLGASLLLEGEGLSDAARKVVQRISGSADRAARLISDLLGFARSRLGTHIPINPQPANLRAIVADVVGELGLVDPDRAVRVSHSGAEDGTWDPDRIAQVISNLVGNALQHGAPGMPIVVTSAIERDVATLEVCNHGDPIPPDELPHLFEPYVRGLRSGAGPGGSIGLGLYIAREVVASHGGTLVVSSTAEDGTRFVVRMPRHARADGAGE